MCTKIDSVRTVKEIEMMRKLIVLLLIGAVYFLGMASALAAKYNEAPMLKALVAAGELPPVDERVGEEPFVVEPFDEIGRYGGTAYLIALTNNVGNNWQAGSDTPFRQKDTGPGLEGFFAKGYEFSEDQKTFTIYLRKGVKWSDGVPFTADDIVFTFEDIIGNSELTPSVWTWNPGGELAKAVKVDDYTVRLEFAAPYPPVLSKMQTWEGMQSFFYNPKHYLKKWHIKYNPDANELAKAEGFEEWWQAFNSHREWSPQKNDLDLPQMTAWILQEEIADVRIYERNPYYWQVDTAGNQLPYIDGFISQIVDMEVYQLKAISGEVDYIEGGLSLENYPLYKENEEQGDYQIVLHPGALYGNREGLGFNFNEKDLVLRRIYHDIRFRQALSVAINRDEINEALFFGEAVPRQVAPLPGNSYYKEEYGDYMIQYDPDMANSLLDEMGLKWDKNEEYRLRPDGERLELIIEFVSSTPEDVSILELVKEYWEAVGAKISFKETTLELSKQRAKTADHGILAAACLNSDELRAQLQGHIDYGYGYLLSYFYDFVTYIGPVEGGEKFQEPDDVVTYQDAVDQWNRIAKWQVTMSGTEEYLELAEEVFDYWYKQLWAIGTVGMIPRPIIVKNSIGNIPEPGKDYLITSANMMKNYKIQFFFKD